jgi:hypothetical protein
MRQTFWLTCAATICAATAGLATQTPGTAEKGKGKTITVSGCVQRASETGATGTTGTSGSTATFELTNAAIAGGAMGTASGSASGSGTGTGTGSGTGSATEATGTSGASAAAKTYRLVATDTQLSAHLNHKVQVTGTIEEASMGGTGTTSEATGTTGSARAAAPTLKVESVKMVSATCP